MSNTIKEIHTRQKDAPWFELASQTSVIIGGAGGISSWLCVLLSRANLDLYVYDFDIIEATNIGGQLYRKDQIGKRKVDALQTICNQFSDRYISVFNEKYTIDNGITGAICIAGFDNMEARKVMFERWLNYAKAYSSPERCLFIDGRLTANEMKIFCITIDRAEAYSKTLFNDNEIPNDSCTFKQTSFGAAMIASHITGFLTNHLSNLSQGLTKEIGSSVPFYWEYNIPIDMLVTEQNITKDEPANNTAILSEK